MVKNGSSVADTLGNVVGKVEEPDCRLGDDSDESLADSLEEAGRSSLLGALERFGSETLDSASDAGDERSCSCADAVQGMLGLVAELTHAPLRLVLLIKRRRRETCVDGRAESATLASVRTDSDSPLPILPVNLAMESLKPKTVFLARLPAPRAIPIPRSLLPFIMTLS